MFASDSDVLAKPAHWDAADQERAVGDLVSLSAPLTAHDTITRDGDIVRCWRLEGVPFETASASAISDAHESLCSLLANLPGGQCTVYAYLIQRYATDRLSDATAPRFCAEFIKDYQDDLAAQPLLVRELYLAVLYRPFPSDTARKMARSGRTTQSLAEQQKDALRAMKERGTLVERTLRPFRPTLLGVREERGVEYWESGELFSYLINGYWRKVRLPSGPCYNTLPDSRLSFGGGLLETKLPNGKPRFAALMDIKEFASKATPGCMDALLYETCEFIQTQSFAVLPRKKAMAALTIQRNQLLATDDAVGTQIAAMDDALNDLGDGKFAMGEYSFTLAVLGDSPDQARLQASACAGAVAEASSMELVSVDLIPDAAWFSQQPGNFKWRTRKATLSSRVFAALTAFHNFPRGKRDGNPWGEALAIMRTPSGQPHYLNFHVTPEEEDSQDNMAPGSTAFLGQTGAGKTTVVASMLAMTAKFKTPPRIISFSLRRDTEFIIRALGGPFYTFDTNVPTGLNPLQREPTEARIGHWTALVKKCLASDGLPLLPDDQAAIASAVRTTAGLDTEQRYFSAIRQSLPRSGGANSLHARFGRWCRGGEHGWVFDMAPDKLGDVRSHRAIGFDYTGVMKNDDVRTPIMMELLNVMEELLTGEPLIYHVSEVWRALGDPIFGSFVKEQQKTIRSRNGIGLFDTQEVSDLLGNENGRTLVSQAATKIALPDPDATYADYVDGLHYTPREFETLQKLGKNSRQFMVKQRHHTVVCNYDLSAPSLRDALTILSPTKENLELLDRIRAEHGDNPDVILPLLVQRARERRALKKAA